MLSTCCIFRLYAFNDFLRFFTYKFVINCSHSETALLLNCSSIAEWEGNGKDRGWTHKRDRHGDGETELGRGQSRLTR